MLEEQTDTGATVRRGVRRALPLTDLAAFLGPRHHKKQGQRRRNWGAGNAGPRSAIVRCPVDDWVALRRVFRDSGQDVAAPDRRDRDGDGTVVLTVCGDLWGLKTPSRSLPGARLMRPPRVGSRVARVLEGGAGVREAGRPRDGAATRARAGAHRRRRCRRSRGRRRWPRRRGRVESCRQAGRRWRCS